MTEDGAWAEYIRAAELLSAERAAGSLRNVWLCCVVEHDIADLRTPAIIEGLGLDPKDLIGPHPACQQLAHRLQQAGYRGLLSPSAALEGDVNLTLFGPRDELHVGAHDEFSAKPLLPDVVEVKPLKRGARPPAHLIGRVREKGADPSTYSHWPNSAQGFPLSAGSKAAVSRTVSRTHQN